jgi:hypothetical protein
VGDFGLNFPNFFSFLRFLRVSSPAWRCDGVRVEPGVGEPEQVGSVMALPRPGPPWQSLRNYLRKIIRHACFQFFLLVFEKLKAHFYKLLSFSFWESFSF